MKQNVIPQLDVTGCRIQRATPARKHSLVLALIGLLIGCSSAEESPTPSGDLSPTVQPTPTSTPAPTPFQDEDSVLIASDGGSYKVHFLRAKDGTIFYTLNVQTALPECEANPEVCAITEVEHTVYEEQDFLTFNMTQLDTSALFAPARVRRVRLTEPPTPVFSLRELDWSNIPGANLFCDYDPANPCGSGTFPTCYNMFPHDLEILHDDPETQTLEVLVSDLAGSRVLKIDFDYRDGNTCGVVDWVLDSATRDWDPWYLPNFVDYMPQDGVEYMATGHYSASPVLGAGAIYLWKRPSESEPWEKVWSYPDPEFSQMPYLNSPHSPSFTPLDDGGYLLRYGHSRGDCDYWKVGYEGSLGAARLDSIESPPQYLFESHFGDDDPLAPMGFVRDVEPLSDGRYMVTDSGCEIYFGCPIPGRVYLMSPEYQPDALPESTGLLGTWTSDGTEQAFQHLEKTKVKAYYCDFTTNYETDFRKKAELGNDLQPLFERSVGQCELVTSEAEATEGQGATIP